MTRAVAVYQAEDDNQSFQFALSREGKVYRRDFKRHTRFGKKWDSWNITSFEEVIKTGFDQFKRIDKDVKVVLP
jgi:hypothetical protein